MVEQELRTITNVKSSDIDKQLMTTIMNLSIMIIPCYVQTLTD